MKKRHGNEKWKKVVEESEGGMGKTSGKGHKQDWRKKDSRKKRRTEYSVILNHTINNHIYSRK